MADPDVDDTDYKRILEIFKKYDVRYFFYNGGNDSMDTCNKISKYMQKVGYECRVMGVPKTIDKRPVGTDHCPGFASAAKYIATSCMEVYQDARVYDTGMVCIIEIMGRHAGWRAGAAALATAYGAGPDLVYLPEVDFDMDKFLADVERIYKEKGNSMVAVSEGITMPTGPCLRGQDLRNRRLRPRPAGRPGRHAGSGGQGEGPAPRSGASSCLCCSGAAPTGVRDRHRGGRHERQGRRGERRGRHHRPDGGLRAQAMRTASTSARRSCCP